MQSVDGDVRLSVGLDTKSVRQNVNDLGRTMKQSLDSFGNVKGFNALDGKVQQLSVKAEKAAQKITALRNEIDKVSTVTTPTEEFTTLNSQIDKLIQTYDELDKKRKDLKSGTTYTAVQERDYQNITSQMQKLEAEIDRLISKRDALVESGKAETVDTAKLDELNLKLKQAQAEYNTATQKLQEFQNTQKQPIQGPPIDSTVNKQLRNTVRNSKSAFSKIGKIISSIGSVAKSAFSKVSRIAKSAFNSIISHAKRTRKVSGDTFTGMNDAIRKGIKNLLRYGLGIRGTFMLFRKLRNAVKEGLQNLAQYSDEVNGDISGIMSAFTKLKNALATMFQPILSVISPILTSIINKASQVATSIGKLIAAFTGQDYVYEAVDVQQDYAKSLDKTAKSATNAKKALEAYTSPLDDINKFQESQIDSGTDIGEDDGSVDPSKMFKISAVESKFKDFAKRIKDMFSSTDWTDIGKSLGEKLNNVLGSIDWAKIISQARDFARRLYTLINGFIAEVDWELVGKTIANGIRTALVFLTTFLQGLNFASIGQAIGELFNGIASPENARLLAQTLTSLFSGALTILIRTLRTIKWQRVSDTIISFISNFDFQKISQMVASLLNTIASALRQIDFKAIGKAFSNGLSKIQWGKIWDGATRVVSSFIRAIADMFGLRGINTVPLSHALQSIKTPIADTLKQLKSASGKILAPIVNKLLPAIVKLIGSIANAITPIIESVAPIISTIVQVVSYIVEAVAPIIEKIGQIIGKIFEVLSPILQPILNLIGRVVQGLAPAVEFILQVVKLLLEPLIVINEMVGGIIDAIAGTSGPTISDEMLEEIDNLHGVSEDLITIQENLDTAMSTANQSINDTVSNIGQIDDLQRRMEELLQKSTLSPEEQKELKTIGDLLSEKLPGFKEAWDQMVQFDSDGTAHFKINKEQMVSSIDDVIEKLKAQYATEALQEQYKQLYTAKIQANQDIAKSQEAVNNAQDKLTEAQNEYNEAVKRQNEAGETYGPLKDAVDNAWAAVKQYGDELSTAQANLLAVKGKQEQVNTQLGILSNTMDVVSGKFDKNKDSLQKLRDAYDQGLIDEKTLKEKYKTTAKELFAATKSVGEQTIAGYKTGVAGGYNEIVTAGDRIGEWVIDAAMEKLEIHSPSKVFENIAKNTIQGYTNGVSIFGKNAIAVTSQFAGNIAKAFQQGVNNFSSVTSILPALFKNTFNQILNNFEIFLSNMTTGINKMLTQVNALNKAYATSGGRNQSYLIWNPNTAIQIPRLAQGAVIPPNKEFLAVLGDQKQGKNIEAPADLIRQIVREETQNTPTSSNVYEIPLVIGRQTLYKLVIDEAKLKMTQTGSNPFELVKI